MTPWKDISAPMRGILLLVAGGFVLTVSDTVTKWLTAGYPVGQIMAVRAAFTLIPIAIFVWHAGGFSALRINDFRLQSLRAGCAVGSAFFFVSGLVFLPLAESIALAFSGPLFVTALATPVLGERVGWRRWSAVAVGFVGILVMLRPTGEAIQWYAALPLLAAFSGAFRDIFTRKIRVSDSPVAILAFTMTAIALAGLCTLPFGWQPIAGPDLLLMGIAGVLVGTAQYLVIQAFHAAEASLIIPFKYLTLIWAALFGFVVWGDIPNIWVVAGACLVVGSGLYIMHRETRLHRR
ncbi:MAG: DMT family transporter [Alphaproteobacteria bacterium]|nr:DMT family transporter [Alphaproteobacteria bacterium]